METFFELSEELMQVQNHNQKYLRIIITLCFVFCAQTQRGQAALKIPN